MHKSSVMKLADGVREPAPLISVTVQHHWSRLTRDQTFLRCVQTIAIGLFRSDGVLAFDGLRASAVNHAHRVTLVRTERWCKETKKWVWGVRSAGPHSQDQDNVWVSGGTCFQGNRAPIYLDAQGRPRRSAVDLVGRELHQAETAARWERESIGYQGDCRYDRTDERDAVLVLPLNVFLFLALGMTL